MKKIDHMTPEQEAYLPKFRDEWLKVGLSTDRVDREASTAAVKRLYAAAGEAEPVVWHFNSPAQCCMAITLMKNNRANLRANLRDNLRANLRDNLWDNLGANLRDNLGANLRDNLRANTYVATPFWGGQDASWLAFYTFAQEIGVRYDKANHLAAYVDYAKTSGWMYAYKGIAFVSDRPSVIKKDNSARLHCEDGPALAFTDGYALHRWHGTAVPASWIEDKANLKAKTVLAERNVEVRMAGCQILGWAKVADQLDRRIVDGDPMTDIGALVELTLPGLPEPGRFLMAQCPRNGTICEGVPRMSDIDGLPIETAIAAQAWRDSLPASEYTHPAYRC